MNSLTVDEIARRVGGSVEGDGDRVVTGLAATDDAGPGDLTIVLTKEWSAHLSDSKAAAALLANGLATPDTKVALIRVDNPRLAFARVVPLLLPEPTPEPGVSASAEVHPDATLGEGVSIGAGAIVEADVTIGDGSRIGPATVVESGAVVGALCRIASNCSIGGGVRMGDRVRLLPGARVGTAGFGFTVGPEGPVRVPQIGLCIIGDDVEIGANSTVDRGALGDTVIGSGTKIDNLVLIAHNAQIGRNCIIVGQSGMAGSVTLGDGVVLGGQVGITEHTTIGDGARVGAQSGILRDIPPGATYMGSPAVPSREHLRAVAGLARLPEILKQLKKLESSVYDETE